MLRSDHVRALLILLLTACGTDTTEPIDTPDSGTVDTGTNDSGPNDSGAPDNTDPLCDEAPPGADDRQILRFTGGGITVILTRDITGLGGGRTWIFEPRRFTLEREGRSDCVTDPNAMLYTWTHHNWDDEMEASAEGLDWKISMIRQDDGGWIDTLVGREGGQMVVGPIDMELLEGPRF